jgi:hypothetical protein
MGSRTRRRLAACAGSVVFAGVVGACIVADPPPSIPPPSPHHPSILHGSVVPPPTKIITQSQGNISLVVPVELTDPTSAFEWHLFKDFDPVSNPLPFAGARLDGDPTAVDAGVRFIDFSFPGDDPALPTKCHVLEFIVALAFSPESPHTPDAYGGDSVVWFYNPSGDPAGCPATDTSGLDGAFPTEGGD